MARRYVRDSIGRFASKGASGAAAKRNVRRLANTSLDGPLKSMVLQDRAMAGSRRVRLSAPEKGDRKLTAQRTQSAITYASAVARRGTAIRTRRFDSPRNVQLSKQINREMTAKQLAKATKVARQNPTSAAAREGVALARMAAAVGGSHPKQRIRRSR